MTITNDGATILKLLEVEHPAAKVLCELAELQDQEVGDGTTSVVRRSPQWSGGVCVEIDSARVCPVLVPPPVTNQWAWLC